MDDKSQHFRSLQLYMLQPGFAYFSPGADPDSKPLTLVELEAYVQTTIESLTDRCFDEPPVNGALLMRGRMSSEPIPVRTLPANVAGKILDMKPSDQNGRTLVEVSIGADDGLKVGDMLQVYRATDSEHKKPNTSGLRLNLVTPDRSVGIMSGGGKGVPFEIGDGVRTDIY
ncbi:MAG: hypothetical protein ACKVII_03340 [Planctomycetales bacterium]